MVADNIRDHQVSFSIPGWMIFLYLCKNTRGPDKIGYCDAPK